MIKTVQIYTNRISADLSPLLAYVYQYNLKHGITLHFDITPVSATGYQSSLVRNMSGNYVWALTGADTLVPQNDHDITVFLFDQSEWKTLWWNPFPLRFDTPTGSCIMSNGKPFINLPYYAPRDADSNIVLIHELMHAYTKIANSQGIPVTDQLDSYYHNDDPDFSNGNFAIQWKLLANWLNPMNTQYLDKWGLVPELETFADKFLVACKAAGYSLKITQGIRTNAEQAILYAKGRTTPGPVVTNAKPGQSQHNFGKAFDVAFTGTVPYPSDDKLWKAIADIGVSLGLTAGYYFKSFPDRPHFEIK